MITNKAKTGLEPINFNKVCDLVFTDLNTKFTDTVLSVSAVKHKVNHAILTIIINFKRKGPKNKKLDAATVETMVEYMVADLKLNKLIPNSFRPTIFKLEQKQFTTSININLKDQ